MSTPLFPRNGVVKIQNTNIINSGSANLTVGCGPTGSTAGATAFSNIDTIILYNKYI